MTQIGDDPSSLELKVSAQHKRLLIQHEDLRDNLQKSGFLYHFFAILLLNQTILRKLFSDGGNQGQLLDFFKTITAEDFDQILDFIALFKNIGDKKYLFTYDLLSKI